ncbi:MAG TPA: asparagine synthase [Cyanobacteria bacterium UBA8553]|nr:asparagine synthase [Cyanobacteria bacterium UBA8553]
MSGILGIWNSQTPTPWQKMLDDLTVLGPDGKGDWRDREVNLSLGRTQFYNTPESAHEAPVVETEGCVLVWDGRLDERESLLAGRPSSTTDAQLIIESYRRWGEDCLRYLIGEFVFILWDASRDLLLVGCDVMGGRTIAYYWDGQTLLLSSRVLTLLHHPQVSKKLDELYLAHTICDFWAQPPGLTPFADIKRLLPGYALILKSGQLQQRQIAKLAVPERYQSPKSPEIYYEKFWYLLNQSVKDRLRSYRPVCTTLSGGLDSTTVTVSLLNHLPKIDAFSIVTDIFPEFDERQPIASFLQRYPQVKWHEVNCDEAWSLSEPWEHLPVPDDPLITCTLPMNLQVMEQIQKQGFGLVFDGEWGDELFYTSMRDLARVGSWGQVLQRLKGDKRKHSTVWQEFVLPHLPKYWQSKWFARWQRKSNPLPPWITSTYAQQPQTQEAIQQYFESYLFTNLVQILTRPTQSSSFVGSTQVYRLLRYAYQQEATSPLQDKRLVEFAIALHPSLQNHPVHEKIFLRQANQMNLPEDVLWRPKTNYFDPLKYVGIAQGHQALQLLEQLKNCPFLQEIVENHKVEAQLINYREKYSKNYQQGNPFCNKTANQLYILFALVNWHQKINNY